MAADTARRSDSGPARGAGRAVAGFRNRHLGSAGRLAGRAVESRRKNDVKKGRIWLVCLLLTGTAHGADAQQSGIDVAQLIENSAAAGLLAQARRVFDLTVDDVIERALDRNLDIAVERVNPQLQDSDDRGGAFRLSAERQLELRYRPQPQPLPFTARRRGTADPPGSRHAERERGLRAGTGPQVDRRPLHARLVQCADRDEQRLLQFQSEPFEQRGAFIHAAPAPRTQDRPPAPPAAGQPAHP